MTLVVYEPETPAMEFIGHALAGPPGGDPVCAALSILMYTLIAALPAPRVRSGEGYCRVEGSEKANSGAYGFTLTGIRLLAENYPQNVRLAEKRLPGRGKEERP